MKSFSFLNVSLLIQGQEMTGWPDGDDSIIAERLSDSAEHVIGNDGAMVMFVTNDRSGTLTFKLLQNSRSNELLTALITAQENNAFVPVFVQMVNTQGGEFVSGTQGYLKRPSNLQFGRKLVPVEWTVVCERLDFINIGVEALQ